MTLRRARSWPALYAFLLFVAACNPTGSNGPPPARAIETAIVAPSDLVEVVSVVGRLEADRQMRVNAEIPERIAVVHVALGQAVRRGDPLVTLSGELQAAGLGQATGALEAARASEALASAQLERVEVLFEAGTASRADLETARRQLESAVASVKQLSGARSQAAVQQARSVARAPIDGIVALLDAKEGDMAVPGRPLAVIVEPGAARVFLDVPERDFSRLAVAQTAEVWPLSDPEHVVTGKLSAVGLLVDPLTRTGKAEVFVDDASILPGSAVRAEIEVDRRTGVLVVPAMSVQLAADFLESREGTVFVVEGDRVEATPVRIGERDGDRLEVREGLEVGAVIATLGAHLLKDGMQVRVVDGGDS